MPIANGRKIRGMLRTSRVDSPGFEFSQANIREIEKLARHFRTRWPRKTPAIDFMWRGARISSILRGDIVTVRRISDGALVVDFRFED
jgi:hypothetical protein